jgi:nucleoside-diphosphate kinase
MIKPDSYLNIGKIISIIESNGFTLGNLKMFRMSPQDAQEFYSEHKSKPYFQALTQLLSSDLAVGLELISDDCLTRLNKILGPENPK